MQIIEWPFDNNELNDCNNFFMSLKCSPVVGSSKTKRILLVLFPFDKKEAIFVLCASPPLRVFEDWPNLIYPRPTSCKGFILVQNKTQSHQKHYNH